MLNVDVLIVGAGPAGASTAVFLGHKGIRSLVISRNPGSADTPRAHIVNQRTMEAFRDVGLERDCLAAGSPAETIANTFWLRSMGGEELARQWTWGNAPARMGDVLTASPCSFVDLPQTKMEPILLAEATRRGANVRFDTELLSFEQSANGVVATLVDRLTGEQSTVRAKYMIGADGANSRVVADLGLPMEGQSGLGSAYNIFCEMDLSRYTTHRRGSLYMILQAGAADWAGPVVLRMVRAWDKWLIAVFIPPTYTGPEATEEQLKWRIRHAVGPDAADLPIKILHTSKWAINDVHAASLSVGRVHCMGDAVHRHPPAAALGSNTCVQDGFNLAWKLALVVNGVAHPRLLDSYDAERQPVAKQIVARANLSMWQGSNLSDYLGGCLFNLYSEEDVDAKLATSEGREALRQQLFDTRYNGEGHGVELTRNYRSGAVVDDGSAEPVASRDAELFYEASTRPGSALPHGWLVTRNPGPLVSTLDLAGKGRFFLFSSHGGGAWKVAADEVARALGVEIGTALIGPGLEYEDPYLDWFKARGVEDDGCVLVRPDLVVGWRTTGMPHDPTAALSDVMSSILGWTGRE